MSLAPILDNASPTQTIHLLHDQFQLIAQRRYLLNASFYAEFSSIMERAFENKYRPNLIACDLLALDLFQPPLPSKPATSTQRAVMASEAGSFFSLLFRTTSYPPTFRASIDLLPVPLRRMIQCTPQQQLPMWFRQRVVRVVAGGQQTMNQQMQQQQQQQQQNRMASPMNTPGGNNTPSASNAQNVEYHLELSLYEYFFLAFSRFLTQPDVQVVRPQPTYSQGVQQKIVVPLYEEATDGFIKLLENYLAFFLPSKGAHSPSLRLEESGWNVASILQHGSTMMEVLAETWFGAYAYELAQMLPPPTAAQQTLNQQVGGSTFYSSLGGSSSFAQQSYIPPDEFTLPTRRLISAFQSIVYHLLEQGYVEPPLTQDALNALTGTRAAIAAYASDKYARHAEGAMCRARVDWMLFGVLQHCFTRWAAEWSTSVGMVAVPVVSAGVSSTGGSTITSSTSYAPAPSRLDDRLTRLVELWMDYLEPWKSIYSQDYNLHVWRWWIVVNLPFYTILLRDFLRLLTMIDIGREKTSARIVHMKTIVHVCRIFDGVVLEQVQEIEALLFKQAGSGGTSSSVGGGAPGTTPAQGKRDEREQQNQMAQQEIFVVRNSLLNLAGLRPDAYTPVFPLAASLRSTQGAHQHLMQQQSSSGGGFSTPFGGQSTTVSPRHGHSYSGSMTPGAGMMMTPRESPMHGRQTSHFPNTPAAAISTVFPNAQQPLIDTQSLALTLMQQYSVGYSSSNEITPAREKYLLDAPSYPVVPKPGEAAKPMSPSLAQQEELAGQCMEKRLRAIFGLPIGGGEKRELNNSPAASGARNTDEAAKRALIPPPKKFAELEPEYASVELDTNDNRQVRNNSSSSSSDFSSTSLTHRYHTASRLTAAGRAQIRLGQKICSKNDIPILGADDELFVWSYEFESLVRLTRPVSLMVQKHTGMKVDLRFMASQTFCASVVIFILLLFIIRSF